MIAAGEVSRNPIEGDGNINDAESHHISRSVSVSIHASPDNRPGVNLTSQGSRGIASYHGFEEHEQIVEQPRTEEEEEARTLARRRRRRRRSVRRSLATDWNGMACLREQEELWKGTGREGSGAWLMGLDR